MYFKIETKTIVQLKNFKGKRFTLKSELWNIKTGKHSRSAKWDRSSFDTYAVYYSVERDWPFIESTVCKLILLCERPMSLLVSDQISPPNVLYRTIFGY